MAYATAAEAVSRSAVLWIMAKRAFTRIAIGGQPCRTGDTASGLVVLDRRDENEGGCRARTQAADADRVRPAGFRERRQRYAHEEACEGERCRQPPPASL